MITLAELDRSTGGRLGRHDAACPACGPYRQSLANQKRKVMRVWRDVGFATYHCARCGESGYAHDQTTTRPDPSRIEIARREAIERERMAKKERLDKAQWLWSQRQPIGGSAAETYLRKARGYNGALPATLAFLPPRGDHGAAMIAAFGFATESEPGKLALRSNDISGVHITRIKFDGSGKAGGDKDKIMIGASKSTPIVLAPANDLLGMAITEGIEDALSAHEATGLGAWAAGSASRLPALAPKIPSWIECVSVFSDDDPDGSKYAAEFCGLVRERSIETYRLIIDQPWRAQRWA